MTEPEDSLLCPQEISDRLQLLRDLILTQPQVERLALDLARFCRGPDAERALAEVLSHLGPAAVCRLASEQLMPRGRTIETNADGLSQGELARALVARRLHVDSRDDWTVALPDGTQLGPMIPRCEGEDSGARLCRLGLLALWILRTRNLPPDAPSF